jgi:site-specific recombinase XerD
MFERYFCPRVVCRLQTNAHASLLEQLLVDLDKSGYARNTIQIYVGIAEAFLRWLGRRRKLSDTIDEATVREFVSRRPATKHPRSNAHAALRHLLRVLRQGQVISDEVAGRTVISRIVAEFDTHLEHTCGLAVATRLYWRRYAREFMQHVFGDGRIDWRRLRPEHLQGFIAEYGREHRIAAAAVGAVSLRSFLRWLQFRRRIGANLAEAVPHLAHWRMASLPTVMTDKQLNAFLAVFDQANPIGSRDYALALCMVDLGLRVSDVADLTLGDVDNIAETLRLTGGKGRRDRVLPMPRRVREAINNYVTQCRPETYERHLFGNRSPQPSPRVAREALTRATYSACV